VKTPTLAIVCTRELEIRNFVPLAYFEVVATAKVEGGQFQMRHAPQERIVRREVAEKVVEAAQGFEGALGVRVEDKRQGPPKLHDLPSLQKLCSSRFGWAASKTLEVAQELYDGQGKKIITYPRAEVRYLPESLISDVPKIVAGLQAGKAFSAILVPDPPIIRKGASGSFHDRGLEGASHHAVIPNVNTVDNLREVWPRLSIDEKKLFDVIARAYLAAAIPVLVPKPFEDPLGRMPLLGRRCPIRFQDCIDHRSERAQLRLRHRLRSRVAGRQREPAHLRDRLAAQAKNPDRLPLAVALDEYEMPDGGVDFHSKHSRPLSQRKTALPLAGFCSGAADPIRRFVAYFLTALHTTSRCCWPIAWRRAKR